MSAKAATGVGTDVPVDQFKHVGVCIIMNGFTGTIKAQGSFEPVEDVDFSAAAGITNFWDYVGMYDYQDGAFVPGDTGLTGSTTTDVRLFTINTNELRSINFHVTARSAGSVTVYTFPVNNQ
jgi:hypothetical protein